MGGQFFFRRHALRSINHSEEARSASESSTAASMAILYDYLLPFDKD